MSDSKSASQDDIVKAVRQAFPAVAKADGNYIFSENAGGSQVLGSVAAKISSYLLETNVQMANYPLAHTAEARVKAGYAATALLIGEHTSPDEVLFGASATQLVENLSRMIEESLVHRKLEWAAGDEIVISEADHETNRGAWKRLAARRGLVVKQWNTSPIGGDGAAAAGAAVARKLNTAALAELVSERTRLVCFTACSNVLGGYVDVKEACEVVKARSGGAAWTVVDAVAYAPHRRPSPSVLGADIVFWSWYKLYGPHVASMYLSNRAQTKLLTRLNHHFLHSYSGTYPFTPSSMSYELIYSTTAVVEYLLALGRAVSSSSSSTGNHTALAEASTVDWTNLTDKSRAELSALLDAAFGWMSAHESTLLAALVGKLVALQERGLLHIVGDSSTSSAVRASTVAFVAATADAAGTHLSSAAVHGQLVWDGKRGAQQGHMYALELIKGLQLDEKDGVVRISLVHYNTVAEAEAVGDAIERALTTLATK